MFNPFERMVAGRYLRARKAEGFVSVIAGFSFLGIMLGVATLIIVMAVMNGFRQELLTRILGLNGHINVYAQTGAMYDYDINAMKIEDIDGVTAAFPLIESQALMTVGDYSSGAVVRAYKQEDFARKPILSQGIIEGNIENFSGNKIALGKVMAERLNLHTGDKITLISPKGKTSPFGTVPRSRSYEIGIIFDADMYEYNNGFVFLPLQAAQLFFSIMKR